MNPYYEQDGITIYHGDCLAVLEQVPDGTAAAIVTDPPYGTRTDQRDGWMVGEYSNVTPLVLPELYRVGTVDAAFYSFTSWKWMADWIMRASQYFRMQNFIIWDKGRHSGCYGAYSWQFHWEGIYFGIKGPRKIRKYLPDVLRSSEQLSEPMQKPVDVICRLIEASTDPGDTIIDPYFGTGSSAVAAKAMDRKFIGAEIDESFCEKTANRLAQGVLFGAA